MVQPHAKGRKLPTALSGGTKSSSRKASLARCRSTSLLTLPISPHQQAKTKSARICRTGTLRFDPDDFFRFFEEQGAFTITGTNTWQGTTVAVTDHCIISGTKHTGSVLTGFIIGDTFGYKCFSDDCHDADIGDVLRKLADDGFDRYPNKIWVEELPTADFNIDITDIEQPIPTAASVLTLPINRSKIKNRSLLSFQWLLRLLHRHQRYMRLYPCLTRMILQTFLN